MTISLGGSIFKRLADDEIVVPHLERALFGDQWPDHYTIDVDYSRHNPPPPDEVGWFYPSTHPLLDERVLYYMLHPKHRPNVVQEKRTLASHMALAMGSAGHAIVQTQLQMAGKVSEEDIEVRFKSDKRRCRGRLDWMFHAPKKTYPVEFKTQHPDAFRRTKEILPYWDAQLQISMDILGYEEGVLLVMMMGYPFDFQEFRVRRNESLLKSIYDKWESVLEHIALDTPPKHCCAEGSDVMEKCRARFVCWLGENAHS